jgi:hypothetical protein
MPVLPTTGSITPKTRWLQYAENALAPLRRKSAGAFMPETNWLQYAEMNRPGFLGELRV